MSVFRLSRAACALALVVTALACSGSPAAGPPTPPPGAPVATTIGIAPSVDTLSIGGSRQLVATVRDSSGVAITGTTVSWSADDTTVVRLAAGLVTARAAGSTVVRAATGPLRAEARIVVRPSPPPPQQPVATTVTVSPAVDSLAIGATRQLVAVVRDQNGAAMPAASIAWTTSDANVATVAAGLVTARVAGTATVRAASGAAAGTASIVVRQPPAATGTCAAPGAGWLWCDDFEQDRLARYFEVNTAGGGFARTPGIGRSGSSGMRARFAAGQVEAGNLKLAFGRTPYAYFRPVDAGTANYREIYWRVWLRHDAGWQGGGGNKLSRATVFAGSNWSQAMIAHLWSGGDGTESANYLFQDPASGTDAAGVLRTTTYNDFPNLRWLGGRGIQTPIFAPDRVGTWYCIETHVRLNDAGQANGVFETWINGVREAGRTDLNWVGSYDAYGINAVFLENFWNNGSPRVQERYFDDFVVSTQRIGC